MSLLGTLNPELPTVVVTPGNSAHFRNQAFGFRLTHRLHSSSFLWFIFRILYKVVPEWTYYGAYGYGLGFSF